MKENEKKEDHKNRCVKKRQEGLDMNDRLKRRAWQGSNLQSPDS